MKTAEGGEGIKQWGTWLVAAVTTTLLALVVAAPAALGEVVTISASKDNTLYKESGLLSNGSGQVFFAGHTGVLTNTVRRGVIGFDIAGPVPPGATITSVTLTLHLIRVSFAAPPTTIGLHRLLADWGEGASDPPFQEGGGAPAEPGDATWLNTFFPGSFWVSPGGDFSATVSASRSVAGIAFYTWGPTTQMRDDVQSWLDNPSSNFGWLLQGDEILLQSARGFDSRQSLTVANRPVLTVNFTSPGVAAGRVPDGGQVPGNPLKLQRDAASGEITLSWDGSCLPTDDDFEIYEGTLGNFTSHTAKLCSTGGATTMKFMPAGGSTFYLVVPRNGSREGSYGTDSGGVERSPGVLVCLPREIGTCP